MIRILAVVVALVMAVSLGVSGAVAQQPKMEKPATDKPPAMEQKAGKTVEGKIKSVSGGVVTLEDGTKLTIPKSVNVPKEQLKPGAVINAEYEEKGASKIATSVQIKG